MVPPLPVDRLKLPDPARVRPPITLIVALLPDAVR
jgi:hypothetical protein